MKLDTLTKLNNKKKLWLTPKHPLFFEDIEFKTIYCAGVFMHATLNKSVPTLNNFELERLLTRGLLLTNKDVAGVMKLAKGEGQIVDRVIGILDSPTKKYLFILDLVSVGMREMAISKEEQQSIDIFCELLQIGVQIKKLIYDFMENAFYGDNNKCIKVFELMLKEQMQITMSELKYYIPDSDYVTLINNKMVKKGESLRIVDNCRITETLVIPIGTTLEIEKAHVYMEGTIVVDGGKLVINDSKLINNKTDNQALIHIKNFSEIEIYNSMIHCCFKGSAINQENGNLKILKSKIYHTTRNSAITFWGKQIIIEDTKFKNCYSGSDGGALKVLRGNGLIKNCVFKECEARSGGAIYTSDELMIQNCSFKHCNAIEFGSAVYYKGEIKSNLTDCDYYECYPKEEEVIQYIGGLNEKSIGKEYTIKVATILDSTIRVTDLGILNIENTIIYMNKSIQCSGMLHIKNSKIVALDFEKRDLFIVERSRGCFAENSEFDGRVKTGIFRSSGTRIHVSNCMFRNTFGGRAIYDAFEPVIKDCIFSYCLGGAVNCCSGTIENCSFINCREKSGAGVLMYGGRGKVNHCKFVRCVTDYSGAAIDMSKGNYAEHCTYEECKPDNITW